MDGHRILFFLQRNTSVRWSRDLVLLVKIEALSSVLPWLPCYKLLTKSEIELTTSCCRRLVGPASSAVYKRWKKAAMLGVSLVADAAEQLERTTTGTKGCPDQGTAFEMPREQFPSNRQKDVESVGVIHSLSSLTSQRVSSQLQVTTEASIQPSMKLKLQLFSIDEGTCKALEKDENNPHLELTLSARTKISSVLEHLNCKWGDSVIASGELMLFPFSI